MAWSFSVTGSDKKQCIAALEADTPPSDPDNAKQYQLMLAVLKHEMDSYGDGSTGMSISASGHAPGADGGARALLISISGAPSPPAEPDKAPPPAEPEKPTPHAAPPRRR